MPCVRQGRVDPCFETGEETVKRGLIQVMRTVWLVGLFLATTFSVRSLPPAFAQASAEPPAGLVAAYGMNEATGTAIADWSTSGLSGVVTGATWTADGRFGSALVFDGLNDWVTVNDAGALDLATGMTLEAWVYPTANGGGSWRNVLMKERSGGEVYNLYANVDTNAPAVYVVRAAQSGTPLDARGTSQLPLNAWSHLAATFDNSTLRVYVNGVQVGSRLVSGPLLDSSGALRIGGNSVWGEFFQGRIDEVRVYNRALTPAEIQIDMSTPVGGMPTDTTPAVRSNAAPFGMLPASTAQTTVSLTTNENATCRYAATAGTAFDSMPGAFTTTGATAHSMIVGGLTSSGSYSYFARCQDTAGNTNADDFAIAFATASPGQDVSAPEVAIQAPTEGATVAGLVTISATATDDVGVVGVEVLLDGSPLGAELVVPPWEVQWNTVAHPNGVHMLSTRARDASGQATTSLPISVAVANNPVPEHFSDEVVIGSGLMFPTSFEFLPDGRLLIAEFRGRVLVAQAGATSVDATPVIELPNIFEEDLTAGGERGLVNVVADPEFVSNGYIYLFYTATTPQRDRVSRFTMTDNAADPASEVVVWQGVADSTSTDHHGGGLAFGTDGKLYVSTGDNGDAPSSQWLTSDHGKILRINKDGTVPADNPFIDGAGPNVDAIWVRGLRNPYRFSFDGPSGRMYIGDVGQNLVEEVNIGAAGANYGWPSCEGSCGTPGMTNPWFTYAHSGRDAAITGGFVYRGAQYPASLQGAYFYGDFAQNWVRYLTLDGGGSVSGGGPFLPHDGSMDGPYDPVMLKQGPDGSIYYVDFGWGWQGDVNPASIRRIRYTAGNQPPVAEAGATPRDGHAPLTVSFSSAGSHDPEEQPLGYLWTFGDGASSTAANPVHTYTTSGQFGARLAVSDGTATSQSDVLTIAVGTAPQATIISPTNALVFRGGDVITFSGSGSDAEDGTLPPAAHSWTILFHHDSHVHPTLGPVSGLTSGTFVIPSSGHDFSGNTFYEIRLTVTDSSGLQHSSSVSIFPHKVNLTFNTSPSGLTFTIDGVMRTAPYVKDTLTGFQHSIGAPDQSQGTLNYGFVTWSDGGAQTHGITAGEADASHTATFQSPTVTAFPSSATVLTGTLSSGTAVALASDDNVYFAVASTTSGTRTAAWYGGFTGISNELSNLRVHYKGKNSGSCTQTVAIWNWTTSAWVQLDSRAVGTTEVAINNLAPAGTLGDYVSGAAGAGELRVRTQCTSTANRTSRGDVMSIVYDGPIGPDTTPPTRSNRQPSGILPAGTTQAVVSLTTDENATCRFGPTPDVTYEALPNIFATTGGTSHGSLVTGVADGGAYVFYVRCQDEAANANPDDASIAFTVANAPPPDGTAPAIVMTSPANGAGVAGNVTVTATATDNVGVVGVQFLIDGVPFGAEDTIAPYSAAWNTVGLVTGQSHVLSARARDAAGNESAATSVSVTVDDIALGLVGAYNFDEGSGSALLDRTGLGHDGILTGAAWNAEGRFGGALAFDGVNDWVTVADANDLDFNTAMTLEAWVYPTSLDNGVWHNVLIKERTGGEAYNLYANTDSNSPKVYVVRASAPGAPLDAVAPDPLSLNTWTHLAVTYDGTTLRLFVNGVQVAARAVSGALVASSGVLRLGGNGVWGEYFAGRIDDVRLYSRALSVAEIQADMATAVQP